MLGYTSFLNSYRSYSTMQAIFSPQNDIDVDGGRCSENLREMQW